MIPYQDKEINDVNTHRVILINQINYLFRNYKYTKHIKKIEKLYLLEIKRLYKLAYKLKFPKV